MIDDAQSPRGSVSRILGIVIFFAVPGCGTTPADQPDVGTVTGVVTLDGEPLWKARLEFQPEDGRPSYGVTNAQGEYELDYLPDVKGAKVGKHVVRISSYAVATGDDGEITVTQPEKVPDVYNTKTALEVTVEPGPNVIPFDLDSSKGEVVQPE